MTARDEFREAVFVRDGRKCCVCKVWGVPLDAHHIIERRLWPDGGYDVDNGATVCESCHRLAEMTKISCDYLRERCGITKIVLPPHLYPDNEYTKWGDIINIDGTRTPGELFEDESVQKILGEGGFLHLYTNYRKYPRTYHLPWSPGLGKDDRVLSDTNTFAGKIVVITEKMDGENTSIYWDGYCHARSLTSSYHPSRERVKALASEIGWQLPRGWRICGENLTAVHSIKYTDLPHWFQVFSIWDENNRALSWKDTIEWAALLDLVTVPIMVGPVEWREADCRGIYPADGVEGYVVRNADAFPYSDFRKNVAKYVRKDHVQSHHWAYQAVQWNEWKTHDR